MLDTPNTYVQDTTLIDYVRFATFNPGTYSTLVADIERKYPEWKRKKWMQYKGRISKDNIFHGSGTQKGRRHFIIECSGYGSHHFALWVSGHPSANRLDLYCTRIDIQRTQQRPAEEYRHEAYKRLGGPKRLEQSDTGITLYIGARTSDTYTRIYDKSADLLRLELELKGIRAKKTWLALLDGSRLDGIYNYLVKKSKVPQIYALHFWADGSPIDKLPKVEIETTLESKLEWIATLDALAYKLANDHDVGERAHEIFTRWTQYGQHLDKDD